MKVYDFKAHDLGGQKIKGTVEAANSRDAIQILRDQGLEVYSLHHHHAATQISRAKSNRAQIWMTTGVAVVVVVLAVVVASLAARQRTAQTAAEDSAMGEGFVSGVSVTPGQPREFLTGLYKEWEQFRTGSVAGIELTEAGVAIRVTPVLRGVSTEEIEALATQTVKSHNSEFGGNASKLMILDSGVPVLEMEFDAQSGTTRAQSHR